MNGPSEFIWWDERSRQTNVLMNSERLVLITDDNEMKRYLATTTYTTLVGGATETTRQQL